MRLVLTNWLEKLSIRRCHLLFFLVLALVSTGSILSALRGRPDNARSSDACGR